MERSSRDTPVFASYLEERRPKGRWVLPVILSALLVALIPVAVWLIKPNPDHFTVVTPTGLRMVSVGMSEDEVGGVLGTPVSSERREGLRCLRYGRPTMKKPVFVLYDACYDENGVLRSFTEKRFTASQVEPPGQPGQPAKP